MTTADKIRHAAARRIGYTVQGHGYNKQHHTLTLRAALSWAACYQARMLMTSSEISKIIEIDRRSIDYMVHKYLERYPHKEPPPHMHRDKITGYVDLR